MADLKTGLPTEGFFRVGGGMMDKCLLAVLPVGGKRMEEALPGTLRVSGGGICKLSWQLLEWEVQGWNRLLWCF